jgi:ankyrin repeat protein
MLEAGADVNAKARKGYTALRYAHEKGHKEIVELLKAHGAKE